MCIETIDLHVSISESLAPSTPSCWWSDILFDRIVTMATTPTTVPRASDVDSILADALYESACLTGPAFLRETDGGGASSTITTTKAHRNVIGVAHETDESNDLFIEELLQIVDERAYDELVGAHPELVDDARSALLTDALAPVHQFDLRDHENGAYVLSDLSFNLMPRRSTLIRHMRAELTRYTADVGEYSAGNGIADPREADALRETLDNVATALDATCSRGAGCYYTSTFFPHVSGYVSAGPVAYGRCAEEVVVDLAGRAINVGMLYEIVGAMNQLVVSTSKGGGNRHRAEDARLCICCLLVQQASNCLDAR